MYERVSAARRVDRVIVATDDDRIHQAVRGFGGVSEMTRKDHPSGTDRIAEVARRMKPEPEIVLNVQGDEPEIESASIDRLVEVLESHPECPVATLACPFPTRDAAEKPDNVKVVCDHRGRALYFSRSLIPFPRDNDTDSTKHAPWLLHLGLYAFRRKFLLEFAAWPASDLERTEKLEQLRVLERGYKIAVGIVEHAAVGVDTPEDYKAFVERFKAGATN